MGSKLTPNHLSAKRQVTVIVRMVVDAGGQLEHGEVVNAGNQRQGWFVDWGGLIQTIGATLAQQEVDGAEQRPGPEGVAP